MRPSAFAAASLIGCLALCLVVAAIGAAVTLPAIPGWYAALAKPDFTPPDGVFGPVWTLLAIMMAVALWRVINRSAGTARIGAAALFGMQLLLNLAWPLLFFGAHSITSGLIVIVLLWIAIVMTIARFGTIDRLAGWLLVPYLLWVSFASLLSLAIFILN